MTGRRLSGFFGTVLVAALLGACSGTVSTSEFAPELQGLEGVTPAADPSGALTASAGRLRLVEFWATW